METQPTVKDTLEQFIDGSSLFAVLEMIQVICEEKAQHIRENWQEDALARDWEKAANRISVVANCYPVIKLI